MNKEEIAKLIEEIRGKDKSNKMVYCTSCGEIYTVTGDSNLWDMNDSCCYGGYMLWLSLNFHPKKWDEL